MKKANLPLPEIGLIASTRALLGTGAGLLLADRFQIKSRKRLGWSLFAVGVFSTIPLAFDICRRVRAGNANH
jgi:hypothetical protein